MEPLNILSETETAPHNNRDFQPWTSNLQLIFHATTLDTCLTFKVDTHNIRNLSKFIQIHPIVRNRWQVNCSPKAVLSLIQICYNNSSCFMGFDQNSCS